LAIAEMGESAAARASDTRCRLRHDAIQAFLVLVQAAVEVFVASWIQGGEAGTLAGEAFNQLSVPEK
jgi:hypothetical protein